MALRTPSSDPDISLTFAEVFPQEIGRVKESRAQREVPVERGERSPEQDLIGLAFSGGGIRSATFNLGVIEALAGSKLLRWVDYLSTVSGGGYVGSWLSSWAYHVKNANLATNHIGYIEDKLTHRAIDIGDCPEPPQIRFLRQYSNYLTPRLGALSGDTLAFVGTYIRNLLLNQTILISFIFAVLLAPRVLGLVLLCPGSSFLTGQIAGVLALGLLVWILLRISRNIVPASSDPARTVVQWIAVPQYFFCVALTVAVWNLSRPGAMLYHAFAGWKNLVIAIGASAVCYTFFWTTGTLFAKDRNRLSWIPVLWAFPVGLAAGCFAALGAKLLSGWDVWYAMTFGVPLTVAFVLFTGSLHLGLVGRSFGDGIREWWARLGGVIFAIALYGFVLCLLSLCVPLYVQWLWNPPNDLALWAQKTWKVLGTLGLTGATGGWVGITLRGLYLAKGANTGGPPEGPPPPGGPNLTKDQWARMAPPVFVVGLVILLSNVVYLIAPALTSNPRPAAADVAMNHCQYWCALSHVPDLAPLGLLCIFLFLLSRFLGWRVDINEFSLHNAYRNRLVRCYLGATNPQRKAQPFTGFDDNDNIQLDCLNEVGAPFHILNATLNAVKANDLALQARKGRSFAFTPLYSGFGNGDPGMPSYRKTQHCSWLSWQYHGARLGTAMAISGAAASPNMGYHTTGAVSFLLTVFSVRLGWWLGNPKRKQWWEAGRPRSSWRALMNELTGATSDDAEEVYLSDGGHFDNLGVYELVRRRCGLIIACDSGADPVYSCTDLIRLVEKCRVDFDTQIKIDLTEILPAAPLFPGDTKVRVSKAPYTTGTIEYPDGRQGKLIYIKPCLSADLPPDVLAYARAAETFPHQSTMDQFFDEDQFESYRAVGYACASAAVGAIKAASQA